MHKHHGRHNDPTHHAHILMYGSRKSHADGGATLGNMASNTPHYKRGGRSRHAEGDMVGTNPITGQKSPDVIERRRGGRACHAEGDTVAVPYRHGGKTHHRRRASGDEVEMIPKNKGGRACHGWGDIARGITNFSNGRFLNNGLSYAEGDTVATPYRHGGETHRRHRDDGGSAALLSHGGETHRRRHAEGDTTQMMRRGGLKKKSREHHGFGQTVGNIASAILPFLPMLLKEGGSADLAAKLAAGGAGKVRKGMLSRSGKPIPAPVHSPRHAPFRPS